MNQPRNPRFAARLLGLVTTLAAVYFLASLLIPGPAGRPDPTTTGFAGVIFVVGLVGWVLATPGK